MGIKIPLFFFYLKTASQNVPKDEKDGQSSSKPRAPADQAGQTNHRHSREVTVESVVRLDDKPELFKNLAGMWQHFLAIFYLLFLFYFFFAT